MPKSTCKLAKEHLQNGFTLIEMMISITLATIAMSSMISVFVNNVKSNGDSISQVHLNQELRAVMDVMSRDIRRAGYWSNAVYGATSNPFQTLAINASTNCITYDYDTSGQPGPTSSDEFGFRLTNNAVQIHKSGGTCSDSSNSSGWENITDPNTIKITALTFDNSSSYCEDLTARLNNCSVTNSGDILATNYIINLTLTGELKNDANVKLSLNETVSIPNPALSAAP